jgi:hypothetical protein
VQREANFATTKNEGLGFAKFQGFTVVHCIKNYLLLGN